MTVDVISFPSQVTNPTRPDNLFPDAKSHPAYRSISRQVQSVFLPYKVEFGRQKGRDRCVNEFDWHETDGNKYVIRITARRTRFLLVRVFYGLHDHLRVNNYNGFP